MCQPCWGNGDQEFEKPPIVWVINKYKTLHMKILQDSTLNAVRQENHNMLKPPNWYTNCTWLHAIMPILQLAKSMGTGVLEKGPAISVLKGSWRGSAVGTS
jgi:hypothetical protein